MTDTVRARKIIAALLAKTVARGATPGEEAAARAKAEQLALKYGLPLHDPWAEGARRYGFNPRPRPAADPASDLFRGFTAAMQREMEEILRRAEALAERRAREARDQRSAEAARRAKEAMREADIRAEREKPGLAQQPAMARLLAYLTGRPKTTEDLAAALGLSQHTVRGMISRLKADGVKLRRFRLRADGKPAKEGKIYHGF